MADLPRSDQEYCGREFRRAIQCRKKQWDHERNIEGLLDSELELEISEWAVNDAGSDLEALYDLYVQLNQNRPQWLADEIAVINAGRFPQMETIGVTVVVNTETGEATEWVET